MSRPELSVIIPTFNRAALLARTLESLCNQDRDAFEVVIADDGSSDDTAEVARRFADRLAFRYVSIRDSGHRVAAARNAGAEEATAARFAFLDSGTLASPQFVLEHAAQHPSEVVIGRTLGYAGIEHAPVQPLPSGQTDWVAAARQLHDVRETFVTLTDGELHIPAPWRLCWSCNMSMSAKLFETAGTFDIGYVGWGLEDVDLAYRASLAGARFAWSRSAAALELPHDRDERSLRDARANVDYFLSQARGVDAELYVWSRLHDADVAKEFDRLFSWAAHVPGAYTPDRFNAHQSDRATWQPDGPALLYLGSAVPGPEWAQVYPFSRGTDVPARIGFALPFPSNAFECALVSDEYQQIWPTWGPEIEAELHRVARRVELAFNSAETRA